MFFVCLHAFHSTNEWPIVVLKRPFSIRKFWGSPSRCKKVTKDFKLWFIKHIWDFDRGKTFQCELCFDVQHQVCTAKRPKNWRGGTIGLASYGRRKANLIVIQKQWVYTFLNLYSCQFLKKKWIFLLHDSPPNGFVFRFKILPRRHDKLEKGVI